MKKTVAIIYHRIDFDGICSLAIIRNHFLKRGWNVDPFPYNRGDTIPDIDLLLSYDEVVIADIALPVDMMAQLAAQWRSDGFRFCWIDHHKTSIEDSIKHGYTDIPGLREPVGQGACGLCWNYFNPGKQPLFVRLLSAYDVWDKKAFDWERQTLPFQYGMRQVFQQNAEDFCEAYDYGHFKEEAVYHIIDNGAIILSYIRQCGRKGVENYGFDVEVGDGHRAVCCLTDQFGGLAFDEALKEHDAAIAICANRLGPDRYNVSVFGTEDNDLDLGRYMKENYNGGGHFNAAGGTMDFNQFKRLTKQCRM